MWTEKTHPHLLEEILQWPLTFWHLVSLGLVINLMVTELLGDDDSVSFTASFPYTTGFITLLACLSVLRTLCTSWTCTCNWFLCQKMNMPLSAFTYTHAIVYINPYQLAFCDLFEALPLQRKNNEKTPTKQKSKKTPNTKSVDCFGTVAKRNQCWAWESCKILSWVFISRREVTRTKFGHSDTVQSPNWKKKLFQLGCSW